MQQEIYKDIPEYEGRYQVSNFGRIKSLAKTINTTLNIQYLPEKIMKCSVTKDGYIEAHLRKNNKPKIFKVHRLVGIAFIPNPNNKPYINHINGKKADNYVENLEWCTAHENVKHAYKTGLKTSLKMGANGNSKLTNEDYYFIIKNEHNFTKPEFANMFNVTKENIYRILRTCA